jgi:hypothetical protein
VGLSAVGAVGAFMVIPGVVITGMFGASRKLSEDSGGRLASSRTGWGSQHRLRYTPRSFAVAVWPQ